MPSIPETSQSLEILFEHDPTVNFAMQQNDVPVVKDLRLRNIHDSVLDDLLVRVRCEPEFSAPCERRIASIQVGATADLNPIDLPLSPGFLLNLNERLSGAIHVDVHQNGQMIATRSGRIDVLACDEWNGVGSLPEILAAFVLPNHPAVETILREAASILQGWTGDGSLSGYQTKNRDRALKIIGSIFAALHRQGIAYVIPPASFESEGQKIRLPHRILEKKLGTCLDLSVLCAACMEQAGLFPLIMMLDGHAFPGAWLIEDCFADCATDDPLRLKKRLELGELCVFESTLLTQPTSNFDMAIKEGRRRLDDVASFRYAIDIARARKSKIRPLPLRGEDISLEPGAIAPEVPKEPGQAPGLDVLGPSAGREVGTKPAEETPQNRLDRWKEKLLDLSLKNRLLNFKETKKTLKVLCPDLAALENALAEGEEFCVFPRLEEMDTAHPRSGQLYTARTGEDVLTEVLREELKARRLRTNITADDMERRLLETYRSARTNLEEGGANTLYLAMGFLAWYETRTSIERRLAPIILIPLELDRPSVRQGFRLRQGDDEPQLNVTLLEKLKKDRGITVKDVDLIPQDEHGIDVQGILTAFRRAVKEIDRWEVVEDAHIGHFSFTKFLMWRDLQTRSDDLTRNAVVKHLIYTPNQRFRQQGDFPDCDKLDETYRPEETYCPLPSDSSQLAAVYAAAADKSFVLEGPPGTGKSQTITNMIAHALATGKTVLFISEKMAALDVVYRRLNQYGLGPFCLQLHSNKTHKTEVLQQLSEALKQTAGRSRDEWMAEARRLSDLRSGLNKYVESLHRRRSIGRSVFQGFSKLIGLRRYRALPLRWDSPDRLRPEDVQDLRDVVDQLRVAGEACGHPGQNPWRAAARAEGGPSLQHEVEALLDQLAEQQTTLRARVRAFTEALALEPRPWSWDDLLVLQELTERLGESARMPRGLLMERDWADAEQLVGQWIAHGRKRDELRRTLYTRYTEAILRLDLDTVSNRLVQADASWAILCWFRRRGIRQELRAVAQPGQKVRSADMQHDLETARQLRDEEAVLVKAGDRARGVLSALWNEGEAAWDEVERFTRLAAQLRSLAFNLAGRDVERSARYRERWTTVLAESPELLQPGRELGDLFRRYREALDSLTASRASLEKKLELNAALAWGSGDKPGELDTLRTQIESWKSNLTGLRPWCNWRSAWQTAVKHKLTSLIESYEKGDVASDDLVPTFERSFYQWWTYTVVESEPVLKNFFSCEHERKLQQFREVDDNYMRLTRDEIHARLAARIPAPQNHVNEDSEPGILRRQIQMKRRQMTVRTLFQKVPNLLPRLKPCLLMSPISVAQYLDPAYPPFDLVVFDEASQMPVWEAVGAIARGKEVVVVGDPKQLPPTNFFGRVEEDEDPNEDAIVQDMESILDDCMAAGLHHLRLRWHYRSRHESLIAFSNYHYYHGDLLTFPSPHLESAVSLRPVPGGVYEKGKARTNRAEGEGVVAEIVRRLTEPELSQRTLGVVTFSQAQQTLIEDLLEEARRNHPEIDPFFGKDQVEPVFVKNLENVQGDERDVILFSICYGPDEQGRVSMNFGPLNREGGHRRLNVAVTRARYEMIVFSTLRPEQIDLARTKSGGVRDLKHFLEYAERGPQALAASSSLQPGDDFESPFEQAVCEALRQRGYEVHSQVGCSGYRIDLGVVDPDQPGRYLLGVECDGANYHRAKTARDRDRLREEVLKGLGWKLFRIWSTDWWENPKEVMEKLECELETARRRKPVVEEKQPRKIASLATPSSANRASVVKPKAPAPPPRTKQRSEPDPPDEPHVYQPFVYKGKRKKAEDFYDDYDDAPVREIIEAVVEEEGPVAASLVARRVVAVYGMGRVGSVIQERFQVLLAKTYIHAERHGEMAFLWPEGVMPSEYREFRIPGKAPESKRNADELPPQEIANAAHYVLRRQVSLPMNALILETARVFGYQRTGRTVVPCMRTGIEVLLKTARAVEQNGNLVVKD